MTQPKNEPFGSTTTKPGIGSTGASSGIGSTGPSSGIGSTGSGIGSAGSMSAIGSTGPGIGSGSSFGPGSSAGQGGKSTHPGQDEKSTQRLRDDIARTRSALSEDMAALGEKLRPDQLKEDAKEVLHHASVAAREGAKDIVRDAKDAALDSLRYAKQHAFDSISEGMHEIGYRARAAGHTVSDFVATNAIPLALLGAGTGWLLISMSHARRLQSGGYRRLTTGDGDYASSRPEGLVERARDRAGEIGRSASQALSEGRERLAGRAHALEERVSERAGELRSQLSEGVSHLGEQASELSHRAYAGMERAGRGAVRVSEQNPLATGLLMMAAGLAVGILLPSTRRENEWLGATRDRLVDKAQRSATELKQSVQQGAGELRGAIADVTHPSH